MPEDLVEPDEAMPVADPAEALLLQTLGIQFIAYTTATDTETIRDRLTPANDLHLSTQQEKVLKMLTQITASIVGASKQDAFLHLRLAEAFGTMQSRTNTSIANMLREEAGGLLWESDANDNLQTELYRQLIDIYPVFLLPASKSKFSSPTADVTISLYRHPRSAAVEDALLAHPVLSKLFTKESTHTGRYGSLYTSAGHGGGVQLKTFPAELIKAAWEMARLSSAYPTTAEHAASIKQVITTITNGIQNKAATVPVQVGLTGVLFPDRHPLVDLGWATVRPADGRDENSVIEATIPGSIQAANSDGQNIEVKYRGDLVVQFDIPYRIRLEDFDIDSGWPEGFQPNRIIQQRIQNIQLGLILSNDLEPRTIAIQSWARTIDPLFLGNFSWRDPQQMRNIHPRKLSIEEVDAWKKWAAIISENRQKGIDVSIRRALLAVSERNTPEDMLVDAVVVWENLFGGRQETTLRVTSSLAWLLASGPEDRKLKQSHYKKIYELRSGVVHGSIDELKKTEDIHKPHEALNTALEALRVIFRDRPDLLAEKDSGARSNRLLLGD